MSNGVKALTVIVMMMVVAMALKEEENTEESNKNYTTIIFSMITSMLCNVQRQPAKHVNIPR